MSKTHKIKQAGYLAAGVLGVAGLCLASAPAGRAQAACAYRWILQNDEQVNLCSGTSEDGTFSSKINDNQEITVTLNNYQGLNFYYENYGTGIPFQKLTIVLTGDNRIDSMSELAFDVSEPIEFTGDGSLLIHSETGHVGDLIIRPGGITDGSDDNDDGSQDSSTSDNEKDPSTLPDGTLVDPSAPCEQEVAKNDVALIWHIISGIYIGISLIVFLILAVKHFGKGKSQPGRKTSRNYQAPNSVAEESKIKMPGKDEDGE